MHERQDLSHLTFKVMFWLLYQLVITEYGSHGRPGSSSGGVTLPKERNGTSVVGLYTCSLFPFLNEDDEILFHMPISVLMFNIASLGKFSCIR